MWSIADGLAHFTHSLQVRSNVGRFELQQNDSVLTVMMTVLIYTDGYAKNCVKNSFTIVIPCNWMLPATTDS